MVEHDSEVKIGLITIWAIGVGSALGGDFFGWQFVLYGGFGSAFLAVLFSGLFYWLYAGAITELAARYKTSGGTFDFVKNALGKRSACAMAILGLLKLILANSALALAISSYLVQGGMSRHVEFLCWISTYGLFTYLDCVGVRQSANAQIMATVLCCLILVFYAASSLSIFKPSSIRDGGLFNDGALGFFKGLPFALQFFDGFEEVPLLMGYAVNPEHTIPRAIIMCYVTVFFIALMVLIAGTGSVPASELVISEAPLMDGIDAVYGPGNFFSDFIAYVIVIGLAVNFFAFVLFASQQIQAIAAGGMLPSYLSYRHPIHEAPIYASISSSTAGLILTSGFAYVFGVDAAQDILVTAALMPAVLGYAMVLESIVKIRRIEHVKSFENRINPRDVVRLGYDPGNLRFRYGILGIRIAQVMCGIFASSLLVLAGVSKDFFNGLIVLTIFSVIMYSAMNNLLIMDDDETEISSHPHSSLPGLDEYDQFLEDSETNADTHIAIKNVAGKIKNNYNSTYSGRPFKDQSLNADDEN
jgi:ethanolamine permease